MASVHAWRRSAGAGSSPRGEPAVASAYQLNERGFRTRDRQLERLKTRSEFRAAAAGKRISQRGFVLQARQIVSDEARPPRFGFTVTKRIGNAVVRNRIRRRLREAVRLAGAASGKSGTDYVLVGRRAVLSLDFDRLVTDLLSGITALSTRTDALKPRS